MGEAAGAKAVGGILGWGEGLLVEPGWARQWVRVERATPGSFSTGQSQGPGHSLCLFLGLPPSLGGLGTSGTRDYHVASRWPRVLEALLQDKGARTWMHSGGLVSGKSTGRRGRQPWGRLRPTGSGRGPSPRPPAP